MISLRFDRRPQRYHILVFGPGAKEVESRSTQGSRILHALLLLEGVSAQGTASARNPGPITPSEVGIVAARSQLEVG